MTHELVESSFSLARPYARR
uniref:Uncharacterized protein n=1 Tax=Rhizophora mucronata TaxID=61149 RepID=A0A2P2NA04_RHIMU